MKIDLSPPPLTGEGKVRVTHWTYFPHHNRLIELTTKSFCAMTFDPSISTHDHELRAFPFEQKRIHKPLILLLSRLIPKTSRMGFVIDLHQLPHANVGISLGGRKARMP